MADITDSNEHSSLLPSESQPAIDIYEEDPKGCCQRISPGAKVSIFVILVATIAAAIVVTVLTTTSHLGSASNKKNLILLISDGFGPASQTMARQFVQKTHGLPVDFMLPLDTIIIGSSRTQSSSSLVTDSASGATAFSCGVKTYNAAVGVDPYENPCATVLEAAALAGYKTGLVATSRITHATPASFASHVIDRNFENDIALQEIGQTPLKVKPDILFGGGLRHFIPSTTPGSQRTDNLDVIQMAIDEGYHFISTLQEFDSLPRDQSSLPVLGLFAPSDLSYEIDRNATIQPSLLDMTSAALELLTSAVTQSDTNGFFLMIEGSRIDHAAHDNDVGAHLQEILMYNEVISLVKSYVDEHPDTVIVSVSDHETGGLTVARQVTPAYPEYVWYPFVLAGVTRSTYFVAVNMRQQSALPPAELQTYITDSCQQYLGITNVTQTEMNELVSLTYSNASDAQQNLIYILSDMVSVRAEIGWTTHGHSAVDVNLYAYPQNDKTIYLRGNHENTDINTFIVNYFNLNLAPLTEQLQQPWSTKRHSEPGIVDEFDARYHPHRAHL